MLHTVLTSNEIKAKQRKKKEKSPQPLRKQDSGPRTGICRGRFTLTRLVGAVDGDWAQAGRARPPRRPRAAGVAARPTGSLCLARIGQSVQPHLALCLGGGDSPKRSSPQAAPHRGPSSSSARLHRVLSVPESVPVAPGARRGFGRH